MGNFRELWQVKAFRDLWLGQTISQLGDSLYYLVFLFMVEKLTGDPRMVALSGIAQTLPFLLLAPFAGVIADRMDRRKILLTADSASAILLGAFAVLVWFDPTPPAWWLIVAGALLSVINVFFMPAKSAAIPQIVPPELLTAANSLSMATQNIMPMIGIALSGTVLALLYALAPSYFFLTAVVLNAASFLVSALFVRCLPPLTVSREETHAGEEKGKALRDLRDGLTYMRGNGAVWMLLWLGVLVNAAIAPYMIVCVEANSQWFGGGYGTFAMCEGAFFLGIVAGSPLVDRFPVRRPGIAYVWSLAVIGVAVGIMSIAQNLWLYILLNVVCGLVFPYAQIPMTTYVQKTVPEAFQGRVNAVLNMGAGGIQPVSIGIGGILLKKLGPGGMLLIMGVGMALASLLGLADRSFREAEMDVEPTGTPEGAVQ